MERFLLFILKKVSAILLLVFSITGVAYNSSAGNCKSCGGQSGDQECYTVTLGDYWCYEDASGDCESGGACS